MLAVVGGVGITAALPILRSHPGQTKLYLGVRTPGIVKAMEPSLQGIDKTVFEGNRMNVFDVIESELTHCYGKAAVVPSESASMADDARMAVCKVWKKKKGCTVKLVEEAFSW